MVMHSRHYAYVMLLSVFVLGGLTGAAATYGVAQMKLARLVSEDRSEMRELRRLNALTRELGLNERQRQSVRQIVDGYRDERERRVRKMFESCGRPVLQLKDTMDGEIARVLDAEQRARFEAMRERRRKFFQGK